MAEFRNVIKWTICICLVIGIILAIVLPIVSFEALDPNEVGLDYDSASVSINEKKLYTSGRHFIGLTSKFIKFP